MTRQHFDLVAATIRRSVDLFKSNHAHVRFAWRMANELEDTNARFDRAKFISACMPDHYVGTRYANVWERYIREAKANA